MCVCEGREQALAAEVVATLLCAEYMSLDRQLNQLDAYLTVLEGRGDKLHEDAQQLLGELRSSREQSNNSGGVEQNGDLSREEQS